LARGMWRLSSLSWLLAIVILLPVVAYAANPSPNPASGGQRGAPAATNEAASGPITTDSFLRHAIAIAKFQSETSKLALRKTKNDTVVGFAHQVSLDYTAAGMKFRQAVAESKLPMPRDALDTSRKTLFDELSKTPPGKPFAKAYVDMITTVLRDDLALYESYAKTGDNARLQYFAQEMVPVVRAHIESAAKLKK
jgi:putative membrane protein